MSGANIGIALALASALFTAIAHVALKRASDRAAIRSWIGFTGILLVLPMLVFQPFPTPAMWPWLLAGNALHTTYQVIQIRAYSTGEIGALFPVARGIAPLTVTLVGAALFDTPINFEMLLGVGIISLGILLIAGTAMLSPRGLLAAAALGLFTTAYTLVDGQGVRAGQGPLHFLVWFFLIDGLLFGSGLLLWKKHEAITRLYKTWRQGLLVGMATFLCFATALGAFWYAPAGVVASFRETAILLVLIFATWKLGERWTWQKTGGGLAIVTGAIILANN